jgi:hypothetical protein
MKIRIDRSGDDLVLPLPDELIERYHLKEGDEFDGDVFAKELERRGDTTTRQFPPGT